MPDRRLSIEEREELSRGLVARESLRSIARRLGRPASTLSREVARNGGMAHYRAARAHRAAHVRARRPKEHRLARHRELARVVEEGLEKRWSPEQIANRLRLEHPGEPSWWVSHEAIYSPSTSKDEEGFGPSSSQRFAQVEPAGARGDRGPAGASVAAL